MTAVEPTNLAKLGRVLHFEAVPRHRTKINRDGECDIAVIAIYGDTGVLLAYVGTKRGFTKTAFHVEVSNRPLSGDPTIDHSGDTTRYGVTGKPLKGEVSKLLDGDQLAVIRFMERYRMDLMAFYMEQASLDDLAKAMGPVPTIGKARADAR